MIRRKRILFSTFAMLALMLACVPALPTLPSAPEPLPTFDPNSLQTAIVQTADAAATQTGLVQPPTSTPTSTPRPTHTATETPTPTFIFLLPTLTFTNTPVTIVPVSADYACQVFSQTPENNSIIARGANFDAKWEVVNVGVKEWDRNSMDYLYISGSRIHRQPLYDFEVNVAPRASVELTVSMRAPSDPGSYSTTWRIRVGSTTFCSMNLTIIVN
ncbi:MAG: hypothetical protein KJZ77_08830 [Anaerolineales bacterium]|nr:hypothetical protein [Anaerolineales bacterium]